MTAEQKSAMNRLRRFSPLLGRQNLKDIGILLALVDEEQSPAEPVVPVAALETLVEGWRDGSVRPPLSYLGLADVLSLAIAEHRRDVRLDAPHEPAPDVRQDLRRQVEGLFRELELMQESQASAWRDNAAVHTDLRARIERLEGKR